MKVRSFFKNHLVFYLLLGLSLVVAGCGGGSDSYDSPETATNAPTQGAETNVLIEPATLKSWIDEGLVNSDDPMKQRVVVIDYGSYETPISENDRPRIQGACMVAKSAIIKTRTEGVAEATPLVATGDQMDAVIQNFGIDEDTVIVFTSSTSPYYATRAYWTFRYWGFSKDQLRLLNGGNAAFEAAYPGYMATEGVESTPSNFSVRDLPGVNTELRASIGEFIQIIKDLPSSDTNVVIDARGDSYYLGNNATSALLEGDKVVVDGHPVGGEYLSYKNLLQDDNTFKPAAEIRALFEEKGWAPGKKVTVYCTSAYSATPLFFALDAILNTDVQLHDGSWSQTGKYSDYASMGGQLPAGSPWAIDDYLDAATVSYNMGTPNPLEIETLQLDETEAQDAPFTDDIPADDSDVNPDGNDVEVKDIADVGTGAPLAFPGPVAGDTNPDALIDANTLEAWMAADLVNAPLGQERVVILDVASADSYAAGHIPGAQFWDITQHVQKRLEGPAPAVNMVVDADRMNELIQSHGIDENTTIVITSSLSATYFPSRAYFLFRYYGWPKEQLKVLNGYNGAWVPAQLTTEEPVVAESTLSVQDIANLRHDLRVSLSELMDAARDGRGVAVDMRGSKVATGSTAGVYDPSGDYVVFEGRINGGKSFVWKNFNYDYDNGDFRFKSASEIEAALNAAGIDNSDVIYSYCRTGYIASTGFFVLDGILDWPVMTYDGSWSQWGKMSDDPDVGGELPEGSPWAVDNNEYMEVINYNVNNTFDIEPLNPQADLLDLDPGDAAANQVEGEDTTYQQEAGAGDEDGAAGPPTPGDSPAIGC